jgi:hypothetical protein
LFAGTRGTTINGATGSAADSWQTFDGYHNGRNGRMPAETGSFIQRTDPLAIPANTATVNVPMTLVARAAGTPSGFIDRSRASLRKVI